MDWVFFSSVARQLVNDNVEMHTVLNMVGWSTLKADGET